MKLHLAIPILLIFCSCSKSPYPDGIFAVFELGSACPGFENLECGQPVTPAYGGVGGGAFEGELDILAGSKPLREGVSTDCLVNLTFLLNEPGEAIRIRGQTDTPLYLVAQAGQTGSRTAVFVMTEKISVGEVDFAFPMTRFTEALSTLDP